MRGDRPLSPALTERHAADKLRWGSGGAQSEAEPPPASPSRQCRPSICGESPQIRRNQPLQSMAADFVFCLAAATGSRPCRPAATGCRLSLPAVPTFNLRGKPADSKKSAALIYGGWFRVLSGGSRWLSALPTGSNRVQAQPAGSADLQSAGEARRFEEISRSNVWRLVSCVERRAADKLRWGSGGARSDSGASPS